MVVIAVMAILIGIGGPALSGLLALEQQRAISELGQTFVWLRDEAALRNVTFRIAFNLDQNTWKVEVGDPNTLAFSNPEDREEYEEDLRDRMDRFTDREIEEGAASEIETRKFEGLDDPAFTTAQALPSGIRFAFVYTPQYGEDGVVPNDEPPEDPEEEAVAYAYVFPDGSTEHIVIRLVDVNDEDDGYTLEIEPLTGSVNISEDEITDPEDSLSWLPEQGPTLR